MLIIFIQAAIFSVAYRCLRRAFSQGQDAEPHVFRRSPPLCSLCPCFPSRLEMPSVGSARGRATRSLLHRADATSSHCLQSLRGPSPPAHLTEAVKHTNSVQSCSYLQALLPNWRNTGILCTPMPVLPGREQGRYHLFSSRNVRISWNCEG